MATTHKLVSLIMCDDCRREDNGKDILIGTYSGSMLSPTIPFVLPTFALRFEIIPKQREYKRTIAIMKNPKGEEIFRVEGSLVINRPEFAATFFYKISPLMIVMSGEYKVYLGMDEEPEEIASLTVLQEQVPQYGMSQS
jgi:hypothetical protein